MTIDYKNTIFLPKTDFPMRAGLPKKEPEILAEWERIGLEKRLREDRKGKEKFILHDGPPLCKWIIFTWDMLLIKY